MIASGDYPDLINWAWKGTKEGPSRYINDGVIVDIKDLAAKYAPNFTKLLKSSPECTAESTLDDGSMYAFTSLCIDPITHVPNGFLARKDWLDKLKIPVPVTIDDWYNMLKAFKEKDPNGNGKADEIPLGDFNSAMTSGYLSAAWGVTNDFCLRNGKVIYGPIDPAFKNYLTTMNKWYTEGLMSKDYLVTDQKGFDVQMTNNQVGAWYGFLGYHFGRYLDTQKGKDGFDLVGVPFPTGPAGKPYTPTIQQFVRGGQGLAITKANKHPVESAKLADYFYSEEGINISNFGVLGESYTMQNGKPVYTDKVLKNANGLTKSQAQAKYALSIGSTYFHPENTRQLVFSHPQQSSAGDVYSKGDTGLVLPTGIGLTSEEQVKVNAVMADIRTFVGEKIQKMITGQISMDKFDENVKTVQGMGVDKITQIYQAAYDRYKSRLK